MKRALITGAGGSIGWYLRILLAGKGYELRTTWTNEPPKPFENEYALNSPANAWLLAGCDEAYFLHITRPVGNITYSWMFGHGLTDISWALEAIQRLDQKTKVMVPGSIRQLDKASSPWHLNQRFTKELVEQFPNAMMPLLGQYISSRGNPKRMYLMQILHELAAGIEPTPARPTDWIQLGHARDGARFLWETLNGIPTTYVAESMQVSDFIALAKTPSHWINEIVEELKEAKCSSMS